MRRDDANFDEETHVGLGHRVELQDVGSGRWRLGWWLFPLAFEFFASGYEGSLESGEFFERRQREWAEHAGETASGGDGGRFSIDAVEHPLKLSGYVTFVEIELADDLSGRPEEIAMVRDDVEKFVVGRLVIQENGVFLRENIGLLT